jgi:asparagine synthase (glutamine-hydrolysing)
VFIFALAAAFVDDVLTRRTVQTLLDAFPSTPPDGTSFAESPRGSAGLSRWAVVRRDKAAAPSWDAARGLLFCGDVRLYNRPELIAELDVPPSERDCSDLELAKRAYLRWGHESPVHLAGDFAFATWEQGQGTLFAARDHLGSRPLYFRKTSEGILVASHLQQIIPFLDSPRDELDGAPILDRLIDHVSDPRRTFFRGVARLRPGHRLVATADNVVESRYWMPPAEPQATFSYEDNCERLRTTFRRAVRDRIESDHPIVTHSSGGFDSSTILMAADEIYRSEPGRAPLIMASALTPGFACDDSNYMDALASRVSFEGIRWNLVNETSSSFPGVFRSAPNLRIGLGGGPRRDLEIATQKGARILISGFMGDEIWYAGDVLRDFVRHARLNAVFRHVSRAGLGWSAFRHTLDWGLGIFRPATAPRIARRLETRSVPPPKWMGPRLREIYPPAPEQFDLPSVDWPSHLLSSLWLRLSRPRTDIQMEGMTDYGIEHGIEVRLPHADVRLIECIMTVPWTQREPKGHHRRTGRDALGPLLPPEFSRRRGQKPWTDVWNATSHRMIQGMAPFFRSGPWVSAPFVDRGIARGMLETALNAGPDTPAPSRSTVLGFGTLEAWLRELSGYNTVRS